MSEPGVGIGEAAALYGLVPSTLRWWESRGVLAAPTRSGARRRYTEIDLRRLGLAYLCCVVGKMPLDTAAIVTSGKADAAAWHRTIDGQIARIDEEIERLGAARDYLRDLQQCPDKDPALCSYLDGELDQRTPRGRVTDRKLVPAARAARDRVDARLPRDETRDETGSPARCPVCRRRLARPSRGRPRTYCSRACRQRAYRMRAR